MVISKKKAAQEVRLNIKVWSMLTKTATVVGIWLNGHYSHSQAIKTRIQKVQSSFFEVKNGRCNKIYFWDQYGY